MRMSRENFKVEIINKEQVVNLFENMGKFSCICYDTPEKFAKKVGESCFQTKHYSGSRAEYIKFKITGVPRALADEAFRHEIGVVKNMKSQRYTDSSCLGVYYPKDILVEEELGREWDRVVEEIVKVYDKTVVTLKEKGYTNEQAREVARGLIPMNIETSFVIGFTIEALINFMNKRLCTCSQEHIRHLAVLMKKEVVKVLPQLESYLVPACISLMYCPESAKRSCGIRPQKHELEELIKLGKTVKEK